MSYNEEFWWEALDDFVSDDEIVIVDIKKGRKHTLSKKDIKWYNEEYLNEN